MKTIQKSLADEKAQILYKKGKLFEVSKGNESVFLGTKTACEKYLREIGETRKWKNGKSEYGYGKLVFVPEWEMSPERAKAWHELRKFAQSQNHKKD